MSFFDVVKNIKIGQIKQLIIWFFKHPSFLLATLYATFKTLKITQKEFPNIHGKHNKANAFRHALWNILIAKKCISSSNNLNHVLSWTTTFTDWHENFVVNKELPRLMDLYNNKMGRILFVQWKNKDTKEIVNLLKMKLESAIKITSKEEFETVNNNLVYLEN